MTGRHQIQSDPRGVERAIVLLLLRDDHEERWSCAELEAELGDAESSGLSAAVERLERAGVVVVQGERVGASRCTRCLDELGLIAV
jgi:DNA-binding HxlR family transcriptional regulator